MFYVKKLTNKEKHLSEVIDEDQDLKKCITTMKEAQKKYPNETFFLTNYCESHDSERSA